MVCKNNVIRNNVQQIDLFDNTPGIIGQKITNSYNYHMELLDNMENIHV